MPIGVFVIPIGVFDLSGACHDNQSICHPEERGISKATTIGHYKSLRFLLRRNDKSLGMEASLQLQQRMIPRFDRGMTIPIRRTTTLTRFATDCLHYLILLSNLATCYFNGHCPYPLSAEAFAKADFRNLFLPEAPLSSFIFLKNVLKSCHAEPGEA